MSLQKIQFRDTDESNLYTVPYNPSQFDALDSVYYQMKNVIDGAPIRSVATFDGRTRTLTWPELPNSNTTYTSMVSELKGYKGATKEVNFQDIDYMSLGWKRIKIINVQTNLMPGGNIRYGLILEYIYLDEL